MTKKILVVDDVAFVRKTISEILSEAGYIVAGEASNGIEALEKYVQIKPDLVTMDIVMPKMGGLEAIRKIAKLDKHAKIIIISAMAQENLVTEAIHVGARDYLLKPFSSRDLLLAVERVLGPAEDHTSSGVRRMG